MLQSVSESFCVHCNAPSARAPGAFSTTCVPPSSNASRRCLSATSMSARLRKVTESSSSGPIRGLGRRAFCTGEHASKTSLFNCSAPLKSPRLNKVVARLFFSCNVSECFAPSVRSKTATTSLCNCSASANTAQPSNDLAKLLFARKVRGCSALSFKRRASNTSRLSCRALGKSPESCNSTARLLLEVKVQSSELPNLRSRASVTSLRSCSAPAQLLDLCRVDAKLLLEFNVKGCSSPCNC
mmetsp:Transcript_119749/g.382241  ORF Transcript_119749/g.382241 Transcript_119749/m.382241 type:complete len:241 (+) Transcript_119749:488-1210(+)